MAFFIYFIHNISKSIQINNILNKILGDSINNLNVKINETDFDLIELSLSDEWFPIHTETAGYYHGYDEGGLIQICENKGLDIIINVHIGQFVTPNFPALYLSKEIEPNDIDSILKNTFFTLLDNHTNHYIYGIKQLTEVGIRSLSPGINDPATALITLNYLSVILALRIKIKDHEITQIPNSPQYIQQNSNQFCTILQDCFAEYRLYGKKDLLIMKKLKSILDYLEKQKDATEQQKQCIRRQMDTLMIDAKSYIENELDLAEFVS